MTTKRLMEGRETGRRGSRRAETTTFLFALLAAFAVVLPIATQLAPPQLAGNLMSSNTLPFNIGSPTLKTIYVSTTGLDAHSGGSPSSPTSFRNAWNNLILRTGSNSSRTTGYRIYLASGTYDDGDIPNYFENSHGTYQFPVVIQAQTPGTVTFTRDFNVFNCRFLYLIDLSFSTNGDSLHFEACHYVLLRRVKADGRGAAQETLKVNQCSMFFVESSEFSGAYENNLDYVAVQSGHILSSKFHGAGDWCAYVKGGSAYIRVHGNQFYNCGTGGFTAGQGSGYEFMTSPWLFYEAVDVKFSNNLIHDTEGACFGCNGCAYTLFAYNNCTRTGSRSHLLEFVPGGRNCDGNSAACRSRFHLGGWGPASHITNGGNDGGEFIPNRNVFVFNNRIVNPTGFQSAWQHLEVRGPQTTLPGTTRVPNPALSDDGLLFRGNYIKNGPSTMELGVGGSSCLPTNPTCNAVQLLKENRFNNDTPLMHAPIPSFPAWTGGFMPRMPVGSLSNAGIGPGGPVSKATTTRTTTRKKATSTTRVCRRTSSWIVPCVLNGAPDVQVGDLERREGGNRVVRTVFIERTVTVTVTPLANPRSR